MKLGFQHFTALQWLGAYFLVSAPALTVAVIVGFRPPFWPIMLAIKVLAALAAIWWIEWPSEEGFKRGDMAEQCAEPNVNDYGWLHWSLCMSFLAAAYSVLMFWLNANAEFLIASTLVWLITGIGYGVPLVKGAGRASFVAAMVQESRIRRLGGTGLLVGLTMGPLCVMLTGVGASAAVTMIAAGGMLVTQSFGALLGIFFFARVI